MPEFEDVSINLGVFRLIMSDAVFKESGVIFELLNKVDGEIIDRVTVEGFKTCRIMRNVISGNHFLAIHSKNNYREYKLNPSDVNPKMFHQFLGFSDALGERLKYYRAFEGI